MVLQHLQEWLINYSGFADFKKELAPTQWGMVYRNIKREDFDETLQSLGNDPAILEHDPGADHLQSKRQATRPNQIGQSWSGISAFKESSLASLHPGMLIVGIGFLGILLALVYLTIQIQELAERGQNGSNQTVVKRELIAIQGQIDDLRGQADENVELILEFLEKVQAKRYIPAKETKRFAIPDPDEVELKKWRHLGVGKNKDGAFVMMHDGQQSRLFAKHAFAKPGWQITEFDQSQATLQGPGGKQVVLISP